MLVNVRKLRLSSRVIWRIDTGAELLLLHVVHDQSLEFPALGMGLAFPGYLEKVPERRKELTASAMQMLEQLVTSAPENAKAIDCQVKFGVPTKEILDFSEGHDVDLIVMGTHGRTGLSHTIIGSVAERVVRHAHCPVLAVRQNQS